MIRFLFRFSGFWLMAGAFVALVVDGTRSIAASQLTFTSATGALSAMSPSTLELVQAKLTQLSPVLWTSIGQPLLNLPIFLLLGVVSALFLLIGQPPERSPFEAN